MHCCRVLNLALARLSCSGFSVHWEAEFWWCDKVACQTGRQSSHVTWELAQLSAGFQVTVCQSIDQCIIGRLIDLFIDWLIRAFVDKFDKCHRPRTLVEDTDICYVPHSRTTGPRLCNSLSSDIMDETFIQCLLSNGYRYWSMFCLCLWPWCVTTSDCLVCMLSKNTLMIIIIVTSYGRPLKVWTREASRFELAFPIWFESDWLIHKCSNQADL